jgi:hypothetical protein
MKKFMVVLSLLLLTVVAFSQDKTSTDDGDKIVAVPKKYVSSEGLNHIQSEDISAQVGKWTGVGKEVGTAVKDGLDAVVVEAEKFGTTKVGNFVMIMIAWKIMGRDLIGIVFGIPLLLLGIWLWIYIARRVFFGYKILDRIEGKIKFYKEHPPMTFNSLDARMVAGLSMGVALIAYIIMSCCIIFGTIL